jgi:hypothetical protein
MRYIYVKEFEDKLSVNKVIPWMKIGGGEVCPLVSFDDAGIHDVVFVSRYDTISDEDLHNHRVWIWEDCTEAIAISAVNEIAYNYEYLFYMKALSRGKSDMGISTLFTGSSYGVHGVDECLISEAVNLSVRAQDLYYSAKGVYEVCKQNHNIKNVVVCCSYYYAFEDMSVHSAEYQQRLINLLYDRIYGDIHNRSVLQRPLAFLGKSDVFDVERVYKNREYACLQQNFFNKDYTRISLREAGYAEWTNLSIDERDKAALVRTDKINKRFKWKYTYNENTDILNKFSQFCLDRSINLVFVVTPMTEAFRKYSNPEFKAAFYEALENAPGEIHVLDLYDSPEYSDGDFIDSDHLDDSGAEKLTKAILATLREINEA